MSNLATPLLDTIHDARDVRTLRKRQLPQLCAEVRQCLIDTVSKTAGHLASGLGVVELTVALHYVYDTPKDTVIWDVGHQAYPHKILTGHRKELATIRQKGGLHAFIWRNETPYDVLSTGHASTSVGSALGLALARRAHHDPARVVAVIGDGSLTGGMALEALNHAGSFDDLNLLVILNDNEMSISENVGSLAQGLSHLLSNPHYAKMVEGGKKVLEKLPAVREFALRAQEHVKGMVMPGTLFEELGFNYIGPIDGHDVVRLVSILRNVRDMKGLQFLHVVTKKGKGYAPAENDPVCYHGVPAFDPATGIHPTPRPADLSFSARFGKWLCDRAKTDADLVGITPAMRVGSAMEEFSEQFPSQFYDVGIAEQHALVLASGLAAGGQHPVVAIYSSFLQRAYDSVIHDVAVQDLPIVLAIDRAGVVGPDGPTHQGAFDIAYLRCVPNLTVLAPADLPELYRMLNTAYTLGHPCAVRYPRTTGLKAGESVSLEDKAELKSRTLVKGSGVAVVTVGPLCYEIMDYCTEQGYTLIDLRVIKPLDEAALKELVKEHSLIVTMEEGVREGGIGEEIAALLSPCQVRVENIGLPDRFLMEGSRKEILEECGVSLAGLKARLEECLHG